MRSQASKPSPKKGTLNKSSLKSSTAKPAKRKSVAKKKVKSLVKKALVKCPKKNSSKDDVAKNEKDSSGDDNQYTPTEAKSGPSKSSGSRSGSPTKRVKKELKDKKDTVKNNPDTLKKSANKKIKKSKKKSNITAKSNSDSKESDNDDVKYKINLKKASSKFSKAKTVKKGNAGVINQSNKKKTANVKRQAAEKPTTDVVEKNKPEKDASDKKENETKSIQSMTDSKDVKEDKKFSEQLEVKDELEINTEESNSKICDLPMSPPEPPKADTERPPKFFTSIRSPRTVDIDVKCFKNSKGNLSMSERFLSMKCESKNDDNNKDKVTPNTLVTQGPEIDVYTFTEKVDSPKSILSDFRSPINKNIGRVRPIARVKGTIIDKKTDSDKKKYSPNRPIEEVVKQLKANKRTEEINANQSQDNNATSSMEASVPSSEKEVEDNPKPIVSKSYKMVARKSSITGKPFSPIKFLDQEPVNKADKTSITPSSNKKNTVKVKKRQKKISISDDELDTCKFSLNTKSFHYTSSEESVSESNDDTKESSESECSQGKKTKNKKYKRITEASKKSTSKELKELSKDSLVGFKDDSLLSIGEKPSKRRLKLLSMWSGPKKHRMASLNAIAKVHCLYENESRTHMELGLMKTIGGQVVPSTSKASSPKKKESKPKVVIKHESTSESEYENKRDKKEDSSESSDDNPPQRSLRGVPGIRSAGKYWDPKSSTSSSEDSEMETKKKTAASEKKKTPTKSSSNKSDTEKPPAKMKKTAGVPVKKKRNRTEVVMDLKDMVVQKRMASLNATAILAASYEKRSPKSSKDDTTSDSCSDESFTHKSKNGATAGIKSEVKIEETTKDSDDTTVTDRNQQVEVIVNQDTDVTITGVYATHHHEGFCTTVSGMQYRISSTSHTQTTATANCEKEGCSRDEGTRYTPLTALSSMQPPAEHGHTHPHPVPEIGGLTRRPGCSSAFTAPPPPSQHHEPGKPAPPFQVYDTSLASMPYGGYYQPAGPLIKETGADAERALARYHPPAHYHPPHPPMPPMQYGPPYYPSELCYSRYYPRPPEPYHMSPQPEPQMVGVGSEPYPLPPYYGPQPCYQHSPPRYVEFRGCSCTLKSCPKNVHIGPATGKAPTGAGPVDALNALAPPGGAFRAKVRAALEAGADSHGSGKDPPLEQEPPAASDAPHPYPQPAIGGASPKREMFDIRDNMRLVSNLSGPVEGGPPSPARGSAGACAPQPPPMAPRRARLGKAMARRSLAGDDTTLLLCAPQAPASLHSDADDDVMAISPPVCAPIDLSSSDERATPLVDVKKENEGPPSASLRKTDAQALREHNSTAIALSEPADNTDTTKPAKRRYSRPKLEIDMKDTQLEDGCKTNGIGEHVKLQKRRKVSCEQPNIPRIETVTKDSKKRNLQNPKRVPKTPTSTKKATKRKSDSVNAINAKKLAYEAPEDADPRLKNVAALPEDLTKMLPTNKSAMLLDKLIRKNSIHRADPNKDISPAELLLDSTGTGPQACAKKTNINNNIVENNAPVSVSGVRANTIAAVTQLIEKKMAYKNACKIEKVDSKVTNSLKSVLKTSGDKLKLNEEPKALAKCKTKSENVIDDKKTIVSDNKSVNPLKNEICKNDSISESNKKILADVVVKPSKAKAQELQRLPEKRLEGSDIKMNAVTEQSAADKQNDCKKKRNKLGIQKPNGNLKKKSIENVAKLLVSKKPSNKVDEINVIPEAGDFAVVTVAADKILGKINSETPSQPTKKKSIKSIEKVAKLLVAKRPGPKVDDASLPQVVSQVETKVAEVAPEAAGDAAEKGKRCKLSGEAKGKAKLLVPKRPVIKTDEAALLVEDACSTSGPMMGRRARRRAGGSRRPRRPAAPLFAPAPQPRATPRWSNGWQWDGEPYISKVYLNNDSRLDRTARCWARMRHLGGDGVARGDCVLLRASTQRAQPFVARVASLWENPDDGEMMVSLVWYYRPEHTERGREPGDAPDEVYASRHRDANSVACIEDKCYVLTFNEYCRYRKRLKAAEEGIAVTPSIVPPLPAAELAAAGAAAPNDTKLPPSVSPELVLFCRKIYDFRSKKIQAPNK